MQEKDKLKNEDIEVLKFLSKFKMLKVEDASLIYKTKRYYRQRINKLIELKYIKKYKSYIIIDKNGRKLLGKVGSSYIKNMDNEAYMDRLKQISSIATITIDSEIDFIPSWDIKEKNQFTETARRYLGKLILENKEYLIYYISAKKEHVYIRQLLFDVNKSLNYDNIIIFVDDFDVISKRYSNLVFGKENTYVIKNTRANKELLKNYEKINIHELLESIYKKELLISDWDKADYLLENNKYVINMPFINTEKIEELNWYYNENSSNYRKIEIVTLEENKKKIEEMLTNKCKVTTFNENLLGGINEIQNIEQDIM